MPQYGEVRVDFITYTTGVAPNEGNVTVPISGLINSPTFSGDVVIEGDLTVSGDIIASGVTISGITGLFASGTEAAPSISFVGDTDTGFYNAAANEIRITTSGNDRLTVDDTGNIGIGTTDPNRPLETRSSGANRVALFASNTVEADIELSNSTTTSTLALGRRGDDLRLFTGDTVRMLIDSDGNVGIGTADPLAKLEVQTANSERIRFNSAGSNQQPRIQLIRDSGADWSIQNSLGSFELLKDDDDVYRYASNAHQWYTAGVGERMRIDSSGRLLVGTTSWSDNDLLAVKGQVGSTTGSAQIAFGRGNFMAGEGQPIASINFVDFSADANQYGSIECITDAAGSSGNDTPGRLVFSTTADAASSPTPRMTIKSDGNVGIGTTTPSNSLHVFNSTADVILKVESGDSISRIELKDNAASNYISTVGGNLDFATNGVTQKMRIDTNGNVGIGTTSPSSLLTVDGNNVTTNLDVTGRVQFTSGTNWNFANLNIRRSTSNVSTAKQIAFLLDGDADNDTNLTNYLNIWGTYNAAPTTGSTSTSLDAEMNLGAPNGIIAHTNNSERARIDSSGRLLVGTTSSFDFDAQTQISGNAATLQVFRYNTGATNVGGSVDFARSSSSTIGTLAPVSTNQGLGIMRFRGAGDASTWISGAKIECEVDTGTVSATSMPGRLIFSTTADGGISPTERMRITNGGNVGIGMTNPQQLLGVGTDLNTDQGLFGISIGSSAATSARKAVIEKNTDSTNLSLTIRASTANTINAPIIFQNSTVIEAMRLAADGKVGINVTNIGQRLSINEGTNTDPADIAGLAKGTIFLSNLGGTEAQNNYGCSISFSRINTTRRGAMIASKQTTTNANQQGLAFFTRGSTNTSSDAISERMIIDHNGNVGIGLNPQTPLHVSGTARVSTLAGTGNRAVYSAPSGSLTNDSSDATLKTNVTTLGNQSEVVKQLRPVTYNWIDTEERGKQQEIGFIAQEVQPLVPQVIGVNSDETLSIDYPKLTAVLTKALQESMERIEQLESRLAALENS